jgi:hypothetical protein
MGWLISFLLAVLVVSVLAIAMPTLFGPVVAGLAPILVVIALIGLGGVWWRRARHPVEAESDQPLAATRDEEEREEVRGEDERVET